MTTNLLIDENINLNEVCRACMGNKQLRPIFGSSLDKMLVSVADVEVNKLGAIKNTIPNYF
jgi:hypothetical protein